MTTATRDLPWEGATPELIEAVEKAVGDVERQRDEVQADRDRLREVARYVVDDLKALSERDGLHIPWSGRQLKKLLDGEDDGMTMADVILDVLTEVEV